jgi:hypothetical protein
MNISTISTVLTAIALEFAQNCYSEIELDDDYGYTDMPAQLRLDAHPLNVYNDTPNLIDYTVIQLGMMADAQLKADADYWVQSDAHQENSERAAEALILDTIAMGAGDRETALRWLKDADDQWLMVA